MYSQGFINNRHRTLASSTVVLLQGDRDSNNRKKNFQSKSCHIIPLSVTLPDLSTVSCLSLSACETHALHGKHGHKQTVKTDDTKTRTLFKKFFLNHVIKHSIERTKMTSVKKPLITSVDARRFSRNSFARDSAVKLQ